MWYEVETPCWRGKYIYTSRTDAKMLAGIHSKCLFQGVVGFCCRPRCRPNVGVLEGCPTNYGRGRSSRADQPKIPSVLLIRLFRGLVCHPQPQNKQIASSNHFSFRASKGLPNRGETHVQRRQCFFGSRALRSFVILIRKKKSHCASIRMRQILT